MQLLGLANNSQVEKRCECEGEFYNKIVGGRGQGVGVNWREWKGGLSTF